MTLFELATAGVPVAVPSRRWLKQLRVEGFNVLNECTFHELANLSTDHLDVWVVDDWIEVLNRNLRSEVRTTILSKHWDVKKLRQSYWNSFITQRVSRYV